MWLSILTSAQCERPDATLRLFEVEFSDVSVVSRRIVQFRIRGLADERFCEKFVVPHIGKSFIGCLYRHERSATFCITPGHQEEIEVECEGVEEEESAPDGKDWEMLAVAALRYYALSYEDAGRNLGLFHSLRDTLESEIDKELANNRKKLDFLREKNPGKWERLTGRSEALRQIQDRLFQLAGNR